MGPYVGTHWQLLHDVSWNCSFCLVGIPHSKSYYSCFSQRFMLRSFLFCDHYTKRWALKEVINLTLRNDLFNIEKSFRSHAMSSGRRAKGWPDLTLHLLSMTETLHKSVDRKTVKRRKSHSVQRFRCVIGKFCEFLLGFCQRILHGHFSSRLRFRAVATQGSLRFQESSCW